MIGTPHQRSGQISQPKESGQFAPIPAPANTSSETAAQINETAALMAQACVNRAKLAMPINTRLGVALCERRRRVSPIITHFKRIGNRYRSSAYNPHELLARRRLVTRIKKGAGPSWPFKSIAVLNPAKKCNKSTSKSKATALPARPGRE